MSKKNGLANPTGLKPFDSDDKQMLVSLLRLKKAAAISLPSTPDEHIFELKKVLPRDDISV